MSDAWRERLRLAVQRSGRKHSSIAWEAGISPETLSRILHASHTRPGFETIARIAHATGESVGWLLGERGYSLSAADLAEIRSAGDVLRRITECSKEDRGQP